MKVLCTRPVLSMVSAIAMSMLLFGCSASGAVVTEPPVTAATPTASPPQQSPPVATLPTGLLQAVSATKPTAAAAAAMARCHIGELIPITSVSGMAELANAADLVRYVPLTGREPQLRASGPVWVIQVRSDLQQQGNEIWTNPTCVVTSDDAGYFATGPVTNTATGKTMTPEAPKTPPDRSLPSLAP